MAHATALDLTAARNDAEQPQAAAPEHLMDMARQFLGFIDHAEAVVRKHRNIMRKWLDRQAVLPPGIRLATSPLSPLVHVWRGDKWLGSFADASNDHGSRYVVPRANGIHSYDGPNKFGAAAVVLLQAEAGR